VSYESRADLAAKIDHEGGIWEMILGYGLHIEDAPSGDSELSAAILRALEAAEPFAAACDALTDLLDDGEL
jgi:hypothetical protein